MSSYVDIHGMATAYSNILCNHESLNENDHLSVCLLNIKGVDVETRANYNLKKLKKITFGF